MTKSVRFPTLLESERSVLSRLQHSSTPIPLKRGPIPPEKGADTPEKGAYTEFPFEGGSEQASLALVFFCFGATMSGVTEVLLIVAIILGIVMLPRALRRPQENDIHQVNLGMRLTGWHRLAILVSLLWPALLALYLKPWHSDWLVYLSVAICPVGLAWGVYWIFSGFRGR